MREVTEKRLQALEIRMTQRVVDATNNANAKLSKLNPAQRRSQESVIVRNELEKVMKTEFENTQVLWRDVGLDEKTSFSGARAKFFELKDSLSSAELEDIPTQLRGSFLAKKKVKSELTTVREMNGLRKKMSEVARIARANGEWNKARIAGEMQDSILDDMDSEGVSE